MLSRAVVLPCEVMDMLFAARDTATGDALQICMLASSQKCGSIQHNVDPVSTMTRTACWFIIAGKLATLHFAARVMQISSNPLCRLESLFELRNQADGTVDAIAALLRQ